MSERFYSKTPFWIYVVLILVAIVFVFLIRDSETTFNVVMGYFGLFLMIGILFLFGYLQFVRKAGIEIFEQSLTHHSIRSREIKFAHIIDVHLIEISYTKFLEIYYLDQSKVRTIRIADTHPLPVRKLVELLQKKKEIFDQEHADEMLQHHQIAHRYFEKKIPSVLNLWSLAPFPFLLFAVGFLDFFFQYRLVSMIVFGVLFLIQIVFALLSYNKKISLVQRVKLSVIVLLVAVLFFVAEIVVILLG
ncbi:MAG: STM3941 family protein [Candidatus Izemoplasmatales bacterium]